MYLKIKVCALRIVSVALGFILSLSMLNVRAASAADLRILTWNSTGENPTKATELFNEINYLNGLYPGTPVKVILNQEAQAMVGGSIYNMLNKTGAGGIGPNYTRPPIHIQEHSGGGAGYNALTHNTTTITKSLTLYDYRTDPKFTAWVNTLQPKQKITVWDEVKNFRPPAYMEFTYAGKNVRLITWHAPLGSSGLLIGCTTKGGAPLDAFLFLEQSNLLDKNNLTGFDIVIIAGDLNMTSSDLGTKCQNYEPLDDFTGESSNLDHILGWRPQGGSVKYFEAREVSSSSVHKIFSSRVNW